MLQQYLDSFHSGHTRGQMAFDVSKAVHLTTTHRALPLPSQYFVSHHVMQQATRAKYLGVIILTNNVS